jgi:hypothetical protein
MAAAAGASSPPGDCPEQRLWPGRRRLRAPPATARPRRTATPRRAAAPGGARRLAGWTPSGPTARAPARRAGEGARLAGCGTRTGVAAGGSCRPGVGDAPRHEPPPPTRAAHQPALHGVLVAQVGGAHLKEPQHRVAPLGVHRHRDRLRRAAARRAAGAARRVAVEEAQREGGRALRGARDLRRRQGAGRWVEADPGRQRTAAPDRHAPCLSLCSGGGCMQGRAGPAPGPMPGRPPPPPPPPHTHLCADNGVAAGVVGLL